MTVTVNNKNELVKIHITNNQKGIKNHKKAASHLQSAAQHHLEAAKYHEEGNHQKAAQSTILAQGHVSLANKAQKTDTQQHAIFG